MREITYGQLIEKGHIIELTIPNIKHPIKAVVLDILEHSIDDNSAHYECIMYAQKKLFKASFKYDRSIEYSYNANDGDLQEQVKVNYHFSLDMRES